MSQYPNVEIKPGSSDQLSDLVSEGIDCALRAGEHYKDNLIRSPLGQLRIINCSIPAYRERYGTPDSPTDLLSHRAVHYALPSKHKLAPWVWMDNGTRHTLSMQGSVIANNSKTYLACALARLGLV